MGPKSQQAIADGQAAIIAALGHIGTELRAMRTTQARIMAKLELEIEDRDEGDKQLGKQTADHERRLNRIPLSLVNPDR
jgi:hypothetical protein